MKLLILFEGLGVAFYPAFSSTAIRDLLAEPLHARYVEYGWTSTGAPCPKEPALVISHSFGIKAGEEFAERCHLPLLSLDPRMPPTGIGAGTAPRGVRTVNFYRTGFMTGYPLPGAENHRLSSSVDHINVPAQPEVWRMVRKLGE